MFECRALGLSNVQIQTNVRRKQNTMNCHLVLLRASNNQCAAFCITKTEKTSNFYHVQSTSFAMYEIVGDNAIRLHFVKSTILCNSTQKDEWKISWIIIPDVGKETIACTEEKLPRTQRCKSYHFLLSTIWKHRKNALVNSLTYSYDLGK